MLVWLFLQPSSWRREVARIDPGLPADFSLAELSAAHWRNRQLRQLLLRTYGICPILVGAITVLVLRALGATPAGAVTGLAVGLGVGLTSRCG